VGWRGGINHRKQPETKDNKTTQRKDICGTGGELVKEGGGEEEEEECSRYIGWMFYIIRTYD
jgi:hypothetical protein